MTIEKAGEKSGKARKSPRIRVSHKTAPTGAGRARRAPVVPVARPELPSRATATRDENPWSLASDRARTLAGAIAVAAIDKKAMNVEILDVSGKVDYADFLVLMTGRSDRHASALAQGIEEALAKENVRPVSVEGFPRATWVLMDFGDVVVHIFQDDARQLYDIDGLWLDARRLPVAPSP